LQWAAQQQATINKECVVCIANEGLVRIQYKCLVPISVE
jgi:hypothetical protein